MVNPTESLNNKRKRISEAQIAEITCIYGDAQHDNQTNVSVAVPDENSDVVIVSQIFDNEDCGFRKLTVERPLRRNFQAAISLDVVRIPRQSPEVHSPTLRLSLRQASQEGLARPAASAQDGTAFRYNASPHQACNKSNCITALPNNPTDWQNWFCRNGFRHPSRLSNTRNLTT